MAVLSSEEVRDVNAWLKSINDYMASIGRLVGACRIAVERLELLLDQNDVPLGSDDLFPKSSEFYENNN